MKTTTALICVVSYLGIQVLAQKGYNYQNSININSFDGNNIDSIPGVQGRDYPTFATPPDTSFRCRNQRFPGYYGDPEARCQAFHICQKGNIQDSFLCPNGTLFNQEFLVCDWWFNVDCNEATRYYGINEIITLAMNEVSQKLVSNVVTLQKYELKNQKKLLNGIKGGTVINNNVYRGNQYLPPK